jgi:hypothetical protein
MTNPEIRKLALRLQLAGFIPALIILPALHSPLAISFVLAFLVHVVGDVLFFLANR